MSLSGLVWGDRPYICGPLGFTSVITCGLYTVSWQFDPCCQYQVETDTSKLPHVELLAVLGPSSPTFLVRKDDRRRRILHTTITLAALGITAWRVYQAFKWKKNITGTRFWLKPEWSNKVGHMMSSFIVVGLWNSLSERKRADKVVYSRAVVYYDTKYSLILTIDL